MELDEKWLLGLTGAIIGLFSMQLPWFVAQGTNQPGIQLVMNISPIDVLQSPSTTIVLGSAIHVSFEFMVLGATIFATGCFFTILDWRLSILMLAGCMVMMVSRPGVSTSGSLSVGFSPGYGIVIGLLATFTSFLGPMVQGAYDRKLPSRIPENRRQKLTMGDVRWIRNKIRKVDETEAFVARLTKAYEAGEINMDILRENLDKVGLSVPEDIAEGQREAGDDGAGNEE